MQDKRYKKGGALRVQKLEVQGMPYDTICKKFKTVGDLKAYYKKHKIKPLVLK